MYNNILESLKFYLNDEYTIFSAELEKVETQGNVENYPEPSPDISASFYFSGDPNTAKVLFLRFDTFPNSKNQFSNKKAEELLNSAITKGMCLAESEYAICTINSETWNDEAFIFEDIIVGNSIKVVITLGDETGVLLCDEATDKSVLKIHGNIDNYTSLQFGHKILVMPTFSPEYILQNSSAKKLFWEDLKLIMRNSE